MNRETDLKEGMRFGTLTVLDRAESKNKSARWFCRCDCGKTKAMYRFVIVRAKTCGCVNGMTTHGSYGTPTYRVWRSMLRRCYEESNPSYPRYGAVGVRVCDRWRESFLDFLADMGEKPEGLQIDRKDNSLGYEPSNCRWVTLVEQANNKRNNHRIDWNGRTFTLADWARRIGIGRKVLSDRLFRYHWPVDRAFTEPVRGHLRVAYG